MDYSLLCRLWPKEVAIMTSFYVSTQVLYVVLVTVSLVTLCGSHCYSKEPNTYHYFAAQTRYEDRIKPAPKNVNPASGCTPRLFYVLIRHGSRFPSTDDYTKMIDHLPVLKTRIVKSAEAGNGSLCPGDLAKLRSWEQRIMESDIDQLADTGVKELEDIGKRYKSMFPGLLNRAYDKGKFLFQSTYMPRNILSAKAFARGIFDNEEAQITFNPKGEDPLLQSYKNCQRYIESLKRDRPEETKLINGELNERTIPAVEDYLGLPRGTMDFDQLFAMYKMCVFDYVVYNDSPWCAAFSRQSLMTMDYLEDLNKYYREGPYYDITMDQSCALLKDVVKYIKLPTQTSVGDHPVGVFRFTHSPVMNPFLAHIGLYANQTQLRGDNMDQLQNRKWRMASLDPYSTHVAFLVEECEGRKFGLRTYINEELYTGVEGRENLNLQTVMNSIEKFANSCDYEQICDLNTATKSLWNISSTLLILTMAVLLV